MVIGFVVVRGFLGGSKRGSGDQMRTWNTNCNYYKLFPCLGEMAETSAVPSFDNAADHTTFSANALRVDDMNLSPVGGRNHNIRSLLQPYRPWLFC